MAEFKSGSSKGTVLTGQPMAVDPMRNPQGGSSNSKDMDWGYFASGVGASLATLFATFPPREAKKELKKASSALEKMAQDEPIGNQTNDRHPKQALGKEWSTTTDEAREWRLQGEGLNRYHGPSAAKRVAAGKTKGR